MAIDVDFIVDGVGGQIVRLLLRTGVSMVDYSTCTFPAQGAPVYQVYDRRN